jgi:GrpB-like predicted nucleotidyltransferase (UPF0157 family)
VLSRTLGLENDTVRLVDYQPNWEKTFLEEQAQLYETLGSAVLDVQHIGSTAVPELSAKPILDIGVAVKDFDEAFAAVRLLERLGYTYRGEYGIARRHYFVKGSPRTHHLHMLEGTSLEWRNHLHLRDYLRTHPEAVAVYQALKTQLAERFPNDRNAYTEGKHAFIQGILNRAE